MGKTTRKLFPCSICIDFIGPQHVKGIPSFVSSFGHNHIIFGSGSFPDWNKWHTEPAVKCVGQSKLVLWGISRLCSTDPLCFLYFPSLVLAHAEHLTIGAQFCINLCAFGTRNYFSEDNSKRHAIRSSEIPIKVLFSHDQKKAIMICIKNFFAYFAQIFTHLLLLSPHCPQMKGWPKSLEIFVHTLSVLAPDINFTIFLVADVERPSIMLDSFSFQFDYDHDRQMASAVWKRCVDIFLTFYFYLPNSMCELSADDD